MGNVYQASTDIYSGPIITDRCCRHLPDVINLCFISCSMNLTEEPYLHSSTRACNPIVFLFQPARQPHLQVC